MQKRGTIWPLWLLEGVRPWFNWISKKGRCPGFYTKTDAKAFLELGRCRINLMEEEMLRWCRRDDVSALLIDLCTEDEKVLVDSTMPYDPNDEFSTC